MKISLKEEALHSSDEAWLVIDKDHWIEDHLTILFEWSKENEKYGLAIRIDGYGISNGKECTTRLKRHFPEYDKSLNPKKITKEMVKKAIERARKNDIPSCEKWPIKTGTTVYRLIERICS